MAVKNTESTFSLRQPDAPDSSGQSHSFNGPSCCLLQIVRVLSRSRFFTAPFCLPHRQPAFQHCFTLPLCLTSAPLDTRKVGRWPSSHKPSLISWPGPNHPAAPATQSSRTLRLQIWSAYFSQLYYCGVGGGGWN